MLVLIGVLILGACQHTSVTHHSGAGLPERVKWLYDDAGWGVNYHYLGPELYGIFDYEEWEHYINQWDVDAHAQRLHKLGIKYVIFNLTQNRGLMVAPSVEYDKNSPPCPEHWEGCKSQQGLDKADFTPTRDLIADLAVALKQQGIRMLVYSSAHAPNRWTGEHIEPYGAPDWWIVDVVKELSLRWGDLVDGWVFDGYGYFITDEWISGSPIAKKIHDATKAGNPNAILSLSPFVAGNRSTHDPYSDFIAGEWWYPDGLPYIPEKRVVDGYRGKKVQQHVWAFSSDYRPPIAEGALWAWGVTNRKLLFTDTDIAQLTKAIIDGGGTISWDLGININGTWLLDRMKQFQFIANVTGNTDDRTYSSLNLINNDHADLRYTGSGWRHVPETDIGNYSDDTHQTTVDGDYVELTFTGSSVVFATQRTPTQGSIEIILDGQSQGVFDTSTRYDYAANTEEDAFNKRIVQEVIFEQHGLADTEHRMRIVKRSGQSIAVDVFGINGQTVILK